MYYFKQNHGVMFHHFHETGHLPEGQGSITAKEFEHIIKYIGVENIINPEEWIYKQSRNLLGKNSICLTFDDALKCQYDIAIPILNKYSIKAFWFIYSSVFSGELEKFEIYRKFRSKYFSGFDEFYENFFKIYKYFDFTTIEENIFKKEVKLIKSQFPFYSSNDIKFRIIRDDILNNQQFELLMDTLIEEKGTSPSELANDLWLTNSHLTKLSADGHYIGMHAYNHPYALSKLSYEEQFEQLKKNFDHITEVTGKKPVSMSYPNNSYNKHTIKILNELNIICAFRSNMKLVKNTSIDNALIFPRMDHSNFS